MSAPIGKSQFSFELPNLSYVDASLEEPNLRATPIFAQPRQQGGLGAWLARRIAAVVAWRSEQVALAELQLMTEHELSDIGLSRADLSRLFDPAHNRDLVERGACA
jgi:uncharacterized protein YjiS (DUF1127 family)